MTSGADFGDAHPSGPLPVGPMPGRGSSGGRPRDDAADDQDYDWFRYLGETGPAQQDAARQSAPAGLRTAPGREQPPGPVSRPYVRPEPPASAPGRAGSDSGGWRSGQGWPAVAPPVSARQAPALSGRQAPVAPGRTAPAAPGRQVPAAPSWRSAAGLAESGPLPVTAPGHVTGPLPVTRAGHVSGPLPVTAARPVTGPIPAVTDGGAVTGAAALPRRGGVPRGARPVRRRSRRHHIVPLTAVGVAAAAAAAAGVFVTHPGLLQSFGPRHTISAPARLAGYSQAPALAAGTGVSGLKSEIVRKGNGEASNVVAAVYEDNAGSRASGPLILLFVGGSLSGSAPSAFISSFTSMQPEAVQTSPGALGGQAACVPGGRGRPAECAWADNDTFGLFASPTLSASELGAQLRAMRPLVEHRAQGS